MVVVAFCTMLDAELIQSSLTPALSQRERENNGG
jgi:hypothetical protein